MQKARFYQPMDNNRVRCLACSHKCIIQDGKSGICSVRKNVRGEFYSLVYGRATGLNPDPIEKKPLYHFQPGSRSLSLGAYGCNFSCAFCQNYELSQSAKSNPQCLPAYEYPPQMIVEQAQKLRCPSISYTYSEPTVWVEYTLDTIRIAREKGIKAVYVSNGYQSTEVVDELIPILDAINIDLKAFSDDFYKTHVGARLEPVLENIKKFHAGGVHLEITTLLIPGLNDSESELKCLADFIAGIDYRIPWHISRFFPTYQMLDRDVTPRETLERAFEIGLQAGLCYVYLGNILDDERSSTFCPNCGGLLIKWVGYSIETLYDQELKCTVCGRQVDVVL